MQTYYAKTFNHMSMLHLHKLIVDYRSIAVSRHFVIKTQKRHTRQTP